MPAAALILYIKAALPGHATSVHIWGIYLATHAPPVLIISQHALREATGSATATHALTLAFLQLIWAYVVGYNGPNGFF
jgi:hypothetical protein